MSRPESVRDAVVAFVDRWRSARLGFAAAGIAYYALVSLLPGLLLLFVAITAVRGDAVAAQVLGRVGDVLSAAGERLVRDAITGLTGRNRATALGAVVLVWGAARLFYGLDRAFDAVADESPSRGLLVHLRDAILALASVGLAVFVVVTAGYVFSGTGLARVVGRFGQFVTLALVLYPVFYVLSEPSVGPVEAIPGAVVTAGGWTLLDGAFRAYLALTREGLLLGVVESVVLLVTWLYFASLLLLVGAVVNSVLADDG